MGDTGLEQDKELPANTAVGGKGGAKSGAVEGQQDLGDLGLAELVAAWASLPSAVKAGILTAIGKASL